MENPDGKESKYTNVSAHASEDGLLPERKTLAEEKRREKTLSQNHEVDPEYARDVLRRISTEMALAEQNVSGSEEFVLDNEKSNRRRRGDDSASGSQNDELVKIATNGVHTVQIHGADNKTDREETPEMGDRYPSYADHVSSGVNMLPYYYL